CCITCTIVAHLHLNSFPTRRSSDLIFTTSFASVYHHYVTKVEKKGRTKAELDQVIEWLTGFDESALKDHLAAGTTFEDFFGAAQDRKSTRLNSSHVKISYAVFCLKK